MRAMPKLGEGQFCIGQVVKHRLFSFRGVIFDVDPEFDNNEEWWEAIPEEARPKKEQPFYHVLAENDTSTYFAYVSQQNLEPDSGGPCRHPDIDDLFDSFDGGRYSLKPISLN
ncbi:heat shock protein HspQ [Iodidimonas gelatinilytica]